MVEAKSVPIRPFAFASRFSNFDYEEVVVAKFLAEKFANVACSYSIENEPDSTAATYSLVI